MYAIRDYCTISIDPFVDWLHGLVTITYHVFPDHLTFVGSHKWHSEIIMYTIAYDYMLLMSTL